MPKTKGDEIQTWLTRAEVGRRLGITGQMVGRHCQRGRIPSREPDGRVPWPLAEEEYHRNVCPERSGSFYARKRETQEPAPARRPPYVGDDGRLQFLADLTTNEQQLDFARVCKLRFGLSSEQAFMVSEWFGFVALCTANDPHIDICSEPTEAEWRQVLGVDGDLQALLELYEQRTAVEIDPESGPRPWSQSK